MTAPLTFETGESDGPVTTTPGRLIVAGYTGRDVAAVQAHIDELAAQGIAPPPAVPMFYDLDPALLTDASRIEVASGGTSGEVEPVYLRIRSRWYLGVGSDHTDRHLEREDIEKSKAACPKPIGKRLIALPDDLMDGGYDPQWDAITVASWADCVPYQQGRLSALRPPGDLLPRLLATTPGADDDSVDLVVYGGTVPLRDGTFVFGTSWRLRLDTGTGAPLDHSYAVHLTTRTETEGTSR